MRDRRMWARTFQVLGACVVLVAVPRAASAFPTTCTWFGTGMTNLWSEPQNWGCGVFRAPENGDTLVFPNGAARPASIDDIPSLQVAGITVTGRGAGGIRFALGTNGASTIVLAGKLLFNSPPAGVSGFGPQITIPMVLSGNQEVENQGSASVTVTSINLAIYQLTVNASGAGVHIGTVGGDGPILKTGTQFLSLTGANTFTGEVHISAGVLYARSNTALGTGASGTFLNGNAAQLIVDVPVTSQEPLTLVDGDLVIQADVEWTGSVKVGFGASGSGLIDVAPGKTFTINGPISGAFPLAKSNTGTLILGGDNSGFTGTLEVAKGVVTARTNAALGSANGSTRVVNGGQLVLDTGFTSTAEPLTLDNGQLSIAATGTSTGSLTLGLDSTISVGSGAAFTVTGAFAGSNILWKGGPGTLILGGSGAGFTGVTVAEAGTLIVNGNVAGGTVNVTGGTLGGNGTVGSVNASSGGVSPGVSPGILHTGAFTLNAGTALTIEVAGTTPGTGYDQVQVTGAVNLGNATLTPTISFTPVASVVFTIIDNDGTDAVTGTFNGLAEGATVTSGGVTAKISYVGGTGNDVTLSVTVTSPGPGPGPGPTAKSYYLSEGATGAFFDEDVLIANPNTTAAPIVLTFLTPSGTPIVQNRTLPPQSRTTIHVDQIPGLENAEVSTVVGSPTGLPLAVERSMFWDHTYYAGHTGSSVDQPSPDWVFAEGSQGFFNTYVLLANANTVPAEVTLTFLREADAPVVRIVTVPASARLTIDCSTIPPIVNRSFGITVHGTQPIIAERAMYFGTTPTRVFSGGNESAGVTGPSRNWFLAEGATGGFFDTFVLLSNPQSVAANVTVQFLLASGETVTSTRAIPANQRVTINIEAEPDPRLKDAAVSTVVTSDVPIVAERSMYWIGDIAPWTESHTSFGVTSAGLHWGLAEGRIGQALNFHTYILLANPQSSAANVTVTFLRENGAAPIVKTYVVPATSRFNIDVNNVSPTMHDETVAADVQVTNGVPIVVERSLYWDSGGVLFKGGTNATGIPLP